MVKKLKTFNLDEETYNQFSSHCKTHGISMSKKIENFLKQELANLKNHSQKQSFPPREDPNQNSPPKKEEEHPLKKYC